ncbi:MAG: hypothetical protein UV73_C0003G0119 [Candidatus Gottesmanbacteria bacterium GW2011_GWA2_43_14]|uniref:(d)CMP kinase n=1 Tax=Candidatus Gottesmanbacteria bacterium GW2011_GWA2_43_14 TaxID=1618443 RepID=A0A0G1DKU1_9BACT|nr:MAG: hypothetical protein UV73_C0003G0119 [Candidatus Gottesmanbacteria bacterium GW2011_GWA2_43_14]
MDKSPVHLPHRVITVSGRVASGATTLSRELAKKLHWILWNGGEIYRQYAREKKIPLERTDLSPDGYHLKLDEYIKEKLATEKNLIMESWLSGFNAQGIDGVFKIFIVCSVDSVRVDRLVNREKITIDEAKLHLKRREEENIKKWKKLYKTADFWNPDHYDLIIDTYQNGPTETLEIALKAAGYYTL